MAKFKIRQQFECNVCGWVMLKSNSTKKNELDFDFITCWNGDCKNNAIEFKLPQQFIEAEANHG